MAISFVCCDCRVGVSFAALTEWQAISTLKGNGWALRAGRAICPGCVKRGEDSLEDVLRASVRANERRAAND